MKNSGVLVYFVAVFVEVQRAALTAVWNGLVDKLHVSIEVLFRFEAFGDTYLALMRYFLRVAFSLVTF